MYGSLFTWAKLSLYTLIAIHDEQNDILCILLTETPRYYIFFFSSHTVEYMLLNAANDPLCLAIDWRECGQ